jgi:hypothetical protein
MISPNSFFKTKPVSRFKFAHSVDPIKNIQKQISMFDGDENEIEVPKSIQDLIASKIRTLSNSLSTAKSQCQTAAAIQEAIQNANNIVKINAINKQVQQSNENSTSQLPRELDDQWYTKGELLKMKNEIDPQRTASHDHNIISNPGTSALLDQMKIEEENQHNGSFKQSRKKAQTNNRKK